MVQATSPAQEWGWALLYGKVSTSDFLSHTLSQFPSASLQRLSTFFLLNTEEPHAAIQKGSGSGQGERAGFLLRSMSPGTLPHCCGSLRTEIRGGRLQRKPGVGSCLPRP